MAPTNGALVQCNYVGSRGPKNGVRCEHRTKEESGYCCKHRKYADGQLGPVIRRSRAEYEDEGDMIRYVDDEMASQYDNPDDFDQRELNEWQEGYDSIGDEDSDTPSSEESSSEEDDRHRLSQPRVAYTAQKKLPVAAPIRRHHSDEDSSDDRDTRPGKSVGGDLVSHTFSGPRAETPAPPTAERAPLLNSPEASSEEEGETTFFNQTIGTDTRKALLQYQDSLDLSSCFRDPSDSSKKKKNTKKKSSSSRSSGSRNKKKGGKKGGKRSRNNASGKGGSGKGSSSGSKTSSSNGESGSGAGEKANGKHKGKRGDSGGGGDGSGDDASDSDGENSDDSSSGEEKEETDALNNIILLQALRGLQTVCYTVGQKIDPTNPFYYYVPQDEQIQTALKLCLKQYRSYIPDPRDNPVPFLCFATVNLYMNCRGRPQVLQPPSQDQPAGAPTAPAPTGQQQQHQQVPTPMFEASAQVVQQDKDDEAIHVTDRSVAIAALMGRTNQ